MPSGLMERFLSRSDAELVNVYGPTEATVWATAWVCRRSERAEMPPIGRPLDNVRCYVLDAGCRPVPVGTVGELFIGGAQLAIGYHHRPDLTAARFLPDPFLPGPGERMYRTGDVCRWRPDGLLEFVARASDRAGRDRGLSRRPSADRRGRGGGDHASHACHGGHACHACHGRRDFVARRRGGAAGKRSGYRDTQAVDGRTPPRGDGAEPVCLPRRPACEPQWQDRQARTRRSDRGIIRWPPRPSPAGHRLARCCAGVSVAGSGRLAAPLWPR